MSRFTGEDRLTAIVAQAMPALIPVDDIKRWKRVDRAIDDSGYIDPSSVQLLGNLLVAFLTEDTVVANASTTAYVTCIEANPELGNGTWTLNVHASASAFHSAGGNTDFRLNIEGVAYDVVTHRANGCVRTILYNSHRKRTGRRAGNQRACRIQMLKCGNGYCQRCDVTDYRGKDFLSERYLPSWLRATGYRDTARRRLAYADRRDC
jgi:hypothetical protein